MTIFTVIRDVCATVGVQVPTSVFASLSTNRTMQEMVSLANEMAQRIAYDTRDWTELRAMASVSGGDGGGSGSGGGDGGGDGGGGDGGGGATRAVEAPTTGFLLPDNFKRLLLTSDMWRSTSTQQPMQFISDQNEWLRRRIAGEENASWGEWIIYGGAVHISPPLREYHPAVPADPLADPPVPAQPEILAETATFAYLDRNCVRLASGGFGEQFVADGDRFRLDERLLKLGMIWQWKAQKGSPYAEDMGSYSDALANAMGHDQPAPILMDGPSRPKRGMDGRFGW
jgi:hypothetical protein